MASGAGVAPRDNQVVAALEEYSELLRSGRRPGRDEFLARHEPIAGVLADHLADLDFVYDVAGHFVDSDSRGTIEHLLPPTRLGEYRLIREVGRGAMGVVYEAEQVPLGRRVALKVLLSAASLDPRHRQRFQVEAQAAALLHHEHIVPVFGIGCDQGVHYYAMQFIEGRSLTDVIQELRPVAPRDVLSQASSSDCKPAAMFDSARTPPPKSTGSSSNDRLHCQTVAQLGLQAALALGHAHDIGVIHRDIKPSNLLIDAHGHLWVADFGLARLPQEDHDLTRTGDLVGTLCYMSPEQVRAERGTVDARTDIYGLGVTLYELSTLRSAFEGRDRHELIRRILDEEPASPRRFNSSIPRDLETIILKAMEKEPAARYASARELADDLKRFLDDQPIRARRPSILDRSVKWSRRHRAVVVTSTTALFVTLAVSTVALWEAKRRTDAALKTLATSAAAIREAKSRTDAALKDSEEAKRRTDAALETLATSAAAIREAKSRTDAALKDSEAVRNNEFRAIHFSLGIFDQIIRPLLAEADSGTSRGEQAKQVGPFAISYYDHISNLFQKDDKAQELVAMTFRQAGFARMKLGATRGRKDYARAIQIFEEIAARFPERIWYRAQLIETLHEYSSLLTAPADAAEADTSLRRALAVAERLLGDREADKHCFSSRLVGPFNSLAWELVRRPTARASDVVLAVRLAEKAVVWERDQATVWNTLGVAHYRAANWPAAAGALRRSMELSHGGTAADWFFLAANLHRQGDDEEAHRWYDRAVTWVQRNPIPDQSQAAELRMFCKEADEVLSSTTRRE
jgi:serine/threonine protein kinase